MHILNYLKRGAAMRDFFMKNKKSIDNFQIEVPDYILDRGYAYYLEGRIHDITRDGFRVYAEVDGENEYQIDIEFDHQYHLKSSICTCPYDKGPICKHTVAVLFYLNDHILNQDTRDLSQKLSKMTKKELINLLIDIANEDERIVMDRMVTSEDICSLMDRYLDDYIYQGYIDYRELPRAIKGFELAIERTEHLNPEFQLMNYLTILKKYKDTYQSVDDSFGAFSQLKEDVLNGLQKAVDGINDYALIRDYLIQFHGDILSQETCFFDEIIIEGLDAIKKLARHDDFYLLFSNDIKLCIDNCSNISMSEYYLDSLTSLLYEMICIHNPDDGPQFILKHLHIYPMQILYIENALLEKDYENVISFCNELENKNNLPNKQWKHYVIKAYRETNEIEKMKVIMKKLIVDGDDVFLYEYRTFFNEDEWHNELTNILEQMKKHTFLPPLYERLLIDEHRYDDMYDLIKKYPHKVFNYYQYVGENYQDDIKEIFINQMINLFKKSNNSKQYQDKTHYLDLFMKAYGRKETKDIVLEIKRLFVNRKALQSVISEFERRKAL